jgi:hypothetical protein
MEEYIHQPMFTYLGNKRKLLDFITAKNWKNILEPYDYTKVKKKYKRMVDHNGNGGHVYEIIYVISRE